MKTKLRRFAIYAVITTTSLFLAFMLLDLHHGTAREKMMKNLIIAVTAGVGTSASLVFFWNSPGTPNNNASGQR